MEKEDNLKEETLRDDMFIGFNEKGNLKAYGSILQKDEEKGLMKLKPITNEKEWKVIEMALKVLQEEAGNNK